MKSERDHPLTIEDLLRLKRAERPPAEFWTTFDRELRAKQLSALVGRRPWWQNLPTSFPRLFRYRIPLGASAVVALSFISLRQDRPAPVGADAAVVVEIPAVPTDTAAPLIPEVAKATERSLVALPGPTTEVEFGATSVVEPPAIKRNTVALGSGMKMDRDLDFASPTPVEITTDSVAIRASEPSVSRTLLAQNTGFESRPVATRAAVEPLQQMTPPGESRRSRFMTAMVAAASSESSYRTTERAASRMAEERLNDQIPRFGARGAGVQLKF